MDNKLKEITKLEIDLENKQLVMASKGQENETLPLYSDASFEFISHFWLKVGWAQKYTYSFSWMGRPVIQLPDDMIRFQEVVYQVKPDVILETGVAHGGSLIYSASLLKAMERGKVIGVDIEIRPHNRKAIEDHELYPWITLIEGNAVAPDTVEHVHSLIEPDDTVLVVLDSCHTYDHVKKELEAYASLVSEGSYIVATDGYMEYLAGAPRTTEDFEHNNPLRAAEEFAKERDDFILEQPAWPFNESTLSKNITHWPSAWLRKQSNDSSQ